jgi:hypothetical protein
MLNNVQISPCGGSKYESRKIVKWSIHRSHTTSVMKKKKHFTFTTGYSVLANTSLLSSDSFSELIY